jgi:uncharacterized protein YjbI with pentapeptide repeats
MPKSFIYNRDTNGVKNFTARGQDIDQEGTEFFLKNNIDVKDVTAADTGGLGLYNIAGNGIFINNSGFVGINLSGATDPTHNLDVSGNVRITGNLTVSGDTIKIITQDLMVKDRNIILGDISGSGSNSDNNIQGGGITLKGDTDKTLLWANNIWNLSGGTLVVDNENVKANTFVGDISGVNISGNHIYGTNISGVNISGNHIYGTNISGVNISGNHIYGTNISGVNISGVNISGNHIYGTNISGVNISGNHIYGTNISGINISGNHIYGTNISGVNISGVNISGNHIYGTNISGINISGEHIYGTNISGEHIYGTNISGINISGVNISGNHIYGTELIIEREQNDVMIQQWVGVDNRAMTLSTPGADDYNYNTPFVFSTNNAIRFNIDPNDHAPALDLRSNANVGIRGEASSVSGEALKVYGSTIITGQVGIGTTSPTKAKLEVSGSVSHDLTATWYHYTGHATNKSGPHARALSAYFEHHIATEQLQVFSDKRIKENIVEIDDGFSLQKVRDISCVWYDYKDKISRGGMRVVGFIAQQVKEHLPEAISLLTDVIPNEMRKLENVSWRSLDISGFNMSSDLQDVSGVKYRFYLCNDISDNEVMKEVVGNEDNTFTFDQSWNNVFCYGKEVDDFHTLDKQKLFALNFSATQEIDRQQTADKIRIKTLEDKLADVLLRLDTAGI